MADNNQRQNQPNQGGERQDNRGGRDQGRPETDPANKNQGQRPPEEETE